MKPVIFWGATGQARVLHEALAGDEWRLLALFDNRDITSPFKDVPIFHGQIALENWQSDYQGELPVHACVAIGGQHGRDRVDIQHWLSARGLQPLSVLHPKSFVAADAVLGDGCQILALAAVCASARLGEAVIVNTKASIDHDCIIGNGAHIAPGATLAGEVSIGDFAFIGSGAVVLPRLHIGNDAIIGAGAVVTRDVAPGETVVGNPARVIRSTQSILHER